MRTSIKTFGFLLSAGIASLGRLFSRDSRGIVLMYHSIEGSDTYQKDSWKYGVSPKIFSMQMEFLATNRSVVPLAQIVEHVKGGHVLSADSVAITIDDGYLDTVFSAYPILKQLNLPFTVFLTTDLSTQVKLGNLPRPTWDMLRELAKDPLVTFGLHGHKHVNLDEIGDNKEALEDELGKSKQLIEEELGVKIRYHAFAAGHRDKHAVEYLKSIGIEAAFGISDGTVKPGRDLFALRRVQIDRTMPFALFVPRTTRGVDVASALTRLMRG